MTNPKKPVSWMGTSRRDLKNFPKFIRQRFGHALWEVQKGEHPDHAKILRGFGGASVLEIREEYEGNAFRAVYSVGFLGVVYVLHVFQKKSKKGIKTPAKDLSLINRRLKMAEEDYARSKKEETPG